MLPSNGNSDNHFITKILTNMFIGNSQRSDLLATHNNFYQSATIIGKVAQFLTIFYKCGNYYCPPKISLFPSIQLFLLACEGYFSVL